MIEVARVRLPLPAEHWNDLLMAFSAVFGAISIDTAETGPSRDYTGDSNDDEARWMVVCVDRLPSYS